MWWYPPPHCKKQLHLCRISVKFPPTRAQPRPSPRARHTGIPYLTVGCLVVYSYTRSEDRLSLRKSVDAWLTSAILFTNKSTFPIFGSGSSAVPRLLYFVFARKRSRRRLRPRIKSGQRKQGKS
ncbi:hypothetical protein K440DRAFT_222512 [Wilcoxina mikolae CBS 423.85]|nr:hypothetical protein K440DRAFT_222512 [Wilcoxina mikolae CBS 423.85]